MAKYLLDHIDVLATMNDTAGDAKGGNTAEATSAKGCGREINDAAILIEDGVIRAVDKREHLITSCGDAEVINLSGHIVIPGMVNTHHHPPHNSS